ncbi:hypothetical protein [Polyangium jinanense]|uniref:Uncharacterized protein n=1 Tax=Polyangium jinanense TaxID=2829994 RepID=A0A9X3XBB2_9BACT|nr:hypothetical protein [Polyangium jinanense]MDC3957034.1 hypothetical protein [Polyangium jinanense]MDC3987092.1 hypothetical protein [Polyangium jinanense]
MGTPSNAQKEEVLKIAAEVATGKRDSADLPHGITLGEPISGEEAKRLLLQELEAQAKADEKRAAHLRVAEALWSKMEAEGVQEGTRGRFEALFVSSDRESAASLAAELGGDEDWEAKVSEDSTGQLQIKVLTRPLVLGLEVVVELANQMDIHAREFGCDFVSLQPTPTKARRPWWRFWS